MDFFFKDFNKNKKRHQHNKSDGEADWERKVHEKRERERESEKGKNESADGGRWRGDGQQENGRVRGTHSKSDGLDWHACRPSALSFLRFLFLSNPQLSFLLPPASAACGTGHADPPSNVNTNTHMHTRPDTHTWVSMVGGETGEGGGGGAHGFISGGMLSVSKDTHFTHSQKQMGAPHSHHRFPANILVTFFRFPWSLVGFYLKVLLFFPSPSPSFFPSILHHTLHLICPLHVLLHPNTLCHPNFIPPFSRPFFPHLSHPSLRPLYVLWHSHNYFFLHGPGDTRITRSYCGEWVCFFWVGLFRSVRWLTVTKRLVEGVGAAGGAATAPWQWARHAGRWENGGASPWKGPASFNKASVIPRLKRPPFLYLSPPLSLSWLNAGKSTSMPKPCREINARWGGGGGEVCGKEATHYLVPLDRDLGKNITWDISPVHSIEFGQWWELSCQRMWGMGLQALMSMKTWQIIPRSSVVRDCMSSPVTWTSSGSAFFSTPLRRTYQVPNDKTFFRCGTTEWAMMEVFSGGLTKSPPPIKNVLLHCDDANVQWGSKMLFSHPSVKGGRFPQGFSLLTLNLSLNCVCTSMNVRQQLFGDWSDVEASLQISFVVKDILAG